MWRLSRAHQQLAESFVFPLWYWRCASSTDHTQLLALLSADTARPLYVQTHALTHTHDIWVRSYLCFDWFLTQIKTNPHCRREKKKRKKRWHWLSKYTKCITHLSGIMRHSERMTDSADLFQRQHNDASFRSRIQSVSHSHTRQSHSIMCIVYRCRVGPIQSHYTVSVGPWNCECVCRILKHLFRDDRLLLNSCLVHCRQHHTAVIAAVIDRRRQAKDVKCTTQDVRAH